MANEGKERKPARLITSLAELEPARVTLEVERPDGEVIAFTGTPVSPREWLAVGFSVAMPQPPISGANPKDGTPLFDYNDPTYRQAVQEANLRRSYARLIAFLDIDVAGETLDEQIATLDARLSAGEIHALANAVGKLYEGEEARIKHRGAAFHDNGSGAGEDDDAPEAGERSGRARAR